jgi:small-conductance mechanosensitive channel/CRP-like cAMP-binding protein
MFSIIDIIGIAGDPIVQTGVLAVIGAVVTRIVLRHHPTRRLIGQLAFFTALSTLLLYHGIVPYQPGPETASNLQRVSVGLAKVVWWVNAAWSLISIVRVFLILEQQPREGRLLQDLVVGVIYVSALLSVVAYVFDAPVGTLIATSGVFAIILGLALQSTLSDVFSGVALNFSRPYGIGDWLVLGSGIEGRVVETNWRATHLLSGANDLMIIPNSDLAKARLTNLSSPERSHGVTLKVRFLPTTMPSAMAEVMRSVLLSSDAILSAPEPGVLVTALDADAVELELSFRVPDIAATGKARSQIYDLIYRHTKAAGLVLSPSSEAIVTAPVSAMVGEASTSHRSTQLRLLDSIALFDSLTDDEKDALAATMNRRTFRSSETIVEQGTVLTSLMVVRSGAATDVRQDHGRETELRRLAPGDFFGEGGLLTGTGEPGTVRALTLVVVYEITQAGLAPLMKDRPAIAEELGALLARRTTAERYRLDQGNGHMVPSSAPTLAARIRHLFDL